MSFLDKFKELFKSKDIPFEKINEIVKDPPSKKDDESLEEETITEDQIEINTFHREEILEIINNVKLDLNDLALDRMEGEAETINSYLKGLIKDLNNYQSVKQDKQKTEAIISSIGGKIKLITLHGLELKNLLASLEDHYYVPLLETLKKVYLKLSREEIRIMSENLEKELSLVKDLESQITRVIGYNDLFNPDKNPKHKEEIEKEAIKRIVHGDLNDLVDKLLNIIVDKSRGIKASIEKSSYLSKVKTLI